MPAPTIAEALFGAANNGQDVTLTMSGTPAAGQVVLVAGGHAARVGTGSDTLGPDPAIAADWEAVAVHDTGLTDDADVDAGAWVFVQPATPVSSFVFSGAGAGRNANAYAGYVLEGVDVADIVNAVSAFSTTVDPPSVTTLVADQLVVACQFENGISPAASAPTGYSNLVGDGINDTVPFAASMASKVVAAAGVEDPGSWPATANAVKTLTFAIKPAGGGAVPAGGFGGSLLFTGTATGQRASVGTATGALALTGDTEGRRASQAAFTDGGLGWSGGFTGRRTSAGGGTGQIGHDGAATGRRASAGGFTGALARTGTSSGYRAARGLFTGLLAWLGGFIGRDPAAVPPDLTVTMLADPLSATQLEDSLDTGRLDAPLTSRQLPHSLTARRLP